MGGQQSAAKAADGAPGGDSSSHGKGRPANNQVQLAVSVLGGVPGATAYHSSVVVNGDEYFFSDGGISSSSGLMSHKNPQMPDSKPEVIEMGMSPYTGSQMRAALERFFVSGTYDLLRKNCNSFSDVALFYLLHKSPPAISSRMAHLAFSPCLAGESTRSTGRWRNWVPRSQASSRQVPVGSTSPTQRLMALTWRSFVRRLIQTRCGKLLDRQLGEPR
ncbi:unnamed protein product [Effrenium voratum]|uniref:PPPDE domain-containing protein n=1 Tax=Effrenium voratum TaxID=2562239 RepID=A0AA36MI72_9DINO|nr:unnamed protein product [Effrenium voratum]